MPMTTNICTVQVVLEVHVKDVTAFLQLTMNIFIYFRTQSGAINRHIFMSQID